MAKAAVRFSEGIFRAEHHGKGAGLLVYKTASGFVV
jgi:hypothetical protein